MNEIDWGSLWGDDEKDDEKNSLKKEEVHESGKQRKSKKRKREGSQVVSRGSAAALTLSILALSLAGTSLIYLLNSSPQAEADNKGQPSASSNNSTEASNSLFHEPADLESLIKTVHGATYTIYCGTSAGSGWGIDLGDDPSTAKDDAYPFEIVTNFHVIEECQNGELITVTRDAKDVGFEAKLYSFDNSFYTATDSYGDLAILMTDTPVNALPTASAAPKAGQWAMAAGNPNSSLVATMDGHLTFGHVSNYLADQSVLVTDAALNHGNSGGPLVNSKGEVMGTNTWGDGSQDAENIAYAIGIPVICQKLVNCSSTDPMRWGN